MLMICSSVEAEAGDGQPDRLVTKHIKGKTAFKIKSTQIISKEKKCSGIKGIFIEEISCKAHKARAPETVRLVVNKCYYTAMITASFLFSGWLSHLAWASG